MGRRHGSWLIVLLVVEIARAATITVNTTADEVNSDGDCSLREAVLSANANSAFDACTAGSGTDTIDVPAGTYTLTLAGIESFANTGDLNLRQDVTIAGAGATTTIVDANDIDRVFDVWPNVNATLSGLTIRNGDATVRTPGTDLGGGIYGVGGTVTVTSCRIESNDAGFGGGIAMLQGALVITGSRITENMAVEYGGGIRTDRTTVTLTDSIIGLNQASNLGAGLHLYAADSSASATIDRCVIASNTSADDGGGIAVLNGVTAVIRNTTISGNAASGDGGGIYQVGGVSITLANCTVAGNTGQGLYHVLGGSFVVRSTILADNTKSMSPVDCTSDVVSEGFNLVEAPGQCAFNAAGDVVGVDPLLVALANNGGATLTHALQMASPAIDAGHPETPGSGAPACEGTDQRGTARPLGLACDIGAFESAFVGTTTTSSTSSSSTSSSTSTTSTSSSSTTTTTSTTPTTLPLCGVGAVPVIEPFVEITKFAAPAGDEKLTIKATLDVPEGVPATLDPTASGMQVRLDDAQASVALFELTAATTPVPPGARGPGCGPKDGWSKLVYKNRSGAIDPPACVPGSALGLRKVKLTDKRAKGKGIAVTVKAKEATISEPTGALGVTLVLAADAGTDAVCATMVFAPGVCVAKGKNYVCQ